MGDMVKQSACSAREEAFAIFNMAWKVSLATFCRIALGTISTAFVGHLGAKELAAAALAGIWVGGAQVLIYGFAVSLCTLCGQAYGAKNYELVGIWLQMGIVFLTIFAVPIVISCFYVDTILSFVNSDPEVLALADTYARFSSLSIWPQCVYCALRQYLQAMEIVTPATLVAGISVIVSLAANYFLINGDVIFGLWDGLGFIGAPLAQFVCSIFQLVSLYTYACYYKRYHEKTWGNGWTWKCIELKRIRRFLNLSVGMAVNMALDEWVYSAVTAVAGFLGTAQIAANAVLFNIWGLLFAVFWGFGLPTQVRCANFLGANEPGLAKRTMFIGFALGAGAAFVAAIISVTFAKPIAYIFSTDVEIVSLIRDTMPVFCLAVFVSALHLILAAVVEAMSLALTLVLITGICSWGVILPSAYVFSISFNGGISGLWWGSVLGEAAKFIAICWALSRVNWVSIAASAVEQSEGLMTEEEMNEDAIARAMTPRMATTPTMPSPRLGRIRTPKMIHHHDEDNTTSSLLPIRRKSFDGVTSASTTTTTYGAL